MKKFDELMLSINKKADIKAKKIKKVRNLFLASVVSLCLVTIIAVGAVSFIPEQSNTPLKTISSENIDTSLKGLIVENFKVSDIEEQSGILADRLGAVKLSDFFAYNYSPDVFAFVRVFDTIQYEDENYDYSSRQDSSVQVISTVWNKDNSIVPDTLIISQSLIGGCIGDEKTNLLRLNGVYLLPLMQDEKQEKWHINFDLDVLFEVDNEGKVWSHSRFEEFSVYDGKDANVLSNDIHTMTSDENFSSAIIPLGQMVVNWGDMGTLSEVTISGVESSKDKWGTSCYKYTFSELNPILTTNHQNIGAISYSEWNTPLDSGTKYLIMLDCSEDGPYIEDNRVAKVNEDGTISPINNDPLNIFTSVNGNTIEQIKIVVEKAITWRNAFGNK